MSKKGDHQIDGYFDYVVPPLEGFWYQGAASAKPNLNEAIDYARKGDFHWISVIRLPDFVTEEVFDGLSMRQRKRKNWTFPRLSS